MVPTSWRKAEPCRQTSTSFSLPLLAGHRFGAWPILWAEVSPSPGAACPSYEQCSFPIAFPIRLQYSPDFPISNHTSNHSDDNTSLAGLVRMCPPTIPSLLPVRPSLSQGNLVSPAAPQDSSEQSPVTTFFLKPVGFQPCPCGSLARNLTIIWSDTQSCGPTYCYFSLCPLLSSPAAATLLGADSTSDRGHCNGLSSSPC